MKLSSSLGFLFFVLSLIFKSNAGIFSSISMGIMIYESAIVFFIFILLWTIEWNREGIDPIIEISNNLDFNPFSIMNIAFIGLAIYFQAYYIALLFVGDIILTLLVIYYRDSIIKI